MICKDISFKTPEENILFDEVLLSMAEKKNGSEVLRFWESPCYFIVLGRVGKVEEEVNLSRVTTDRVKVLRRCSGGGTVVQGPGCLNYSLVLSKNRHPRVSDLKDSYQYIIEKIVSCLKAMQVSARFYPISDIALVENDKKISGNAQRRMRNHILHHGTLLYDFDLDKIAELLTMPQDVPPYRKSRGHLDFVTNISNKNIINFKEAMMREFNLEGSDHDILLEEAQILKRMQQERNPLCG